MNQCHLLELHCSKTICVIVLQDFCLSEQFSTLFCTEREAIYSHTQNARILFKWKPYLSRMDSNEQKLKCLICLLCFVVYPPARLILSFSLRHQVTTCLVAHIVLCLVPCMEYTIAVKCLTRSHRIAE